MPAYRRHAGISALFGVSPDSLAEGCFDGPSLTGAGELPNPSGIGRWQSGVELRHAGAGRILPSADAPPRNGTDAAILSTKPGALGHSSKRLVNLVNVVAAASRTSEEEVL